MNIPDSLHYTEKHEWVKITDSIAEIGITDFAQTSMGELVYVELPEIGRQVKAGDALAVVESIKTASDVYTPLSGKVIEINEKLSDAAELVNEAPYENWLAKVELSSLDEIDGLLNKEAYAAVCSKEG